MSRRRAPLRCFCGAYATHGVLERPTPDNPHPLVEPRCETHGAVRRVAPVVAASAKELAYV